MMSRAWVPVLVIVLVAATTGPANGQDDEAVAPDSMLVISESEVDDSLASEGDELVEGYVESSYLIETVEEASQGDQAFTTEWSAGSPAMDTLDIYGATHESIVTHDGCATSDGDFGGIMFRDMWTAPDGVPDY